MRVLKRYTIKSVLRVGFITTLLATFMLVGVELFSNIETYINNSIPFSRALSISFLYGPEALLLALGPSFLFSITYYLSMLHSSNEILCILGSGISYKKVLRPLIILSIVLTVFHFCFNETVVITTTNMKDNLKRESLQSYENNSNSNVALSDLKEGYVVYASSYSETSRTLYKVTYIESNTNLRIDGFSATWSDEDNCWTFQDAIVKEIVQTND
ncbi:MAG: LptF/LptG family permease, partial [Sphaerochaetaceae bacterium]|nr:LptF/LptG family permease [Sphaerochaetaceae bacterium]